MPNLRIVSDNAIDRATLTPTSAAMPIANLLSELKSTVWRGVGKTESIRATWPTAEQIGCVALPFCNLSSKATMRVRVTNEAVATNVLSSPNSFASWTKTGTSVGAAVASPDGTASATTIAATAGGGTISLSAAVGAGNYVSSVWIRRRAGSGAVSIRNAANSAWLPLDVSDTWARFSNDGGPAGGTGLLSLQIASSGDAIDIAFAQVEAGSIATSYYPGTRPLGYIDSWQSYAYDSGTVLCCADPVVKLRGWTAAQSASAYAYGGGSFARVWLPTTSALGLCVDVTDTNNAQGYIEAARLVAGPYWETACNPSAVTITNVDTTVHTRLESGDQWTDAGKTYKKMQVTLSKLPSQDRAPFFNMVRNSRTYPILISVMPTASNEAETLVYGRRSADSDAALQFALTYSSAVTVEGI